MPTAADARTAHLSTLPQIGGAWGTLPVGERLQFGLETAFLVGFQVDKINYLRLGGGGLQVSLSTTLWLFDLSGGAYANLYLDEAKRMRLYAGAGPLMMYANYRNDRSFSDNSDSEVDTYTAFGVGAYARAGVEYRVENFGHGRADGPQSMGRHRPSGCRRERFTLRNRRVRHLYRRLLIKFISQAELHSRSLFRL